MQHATRHAALGSRPSLTFGRQRPFGLTSGPMLAFRALVVVCLAATFWITWPLWQVHASPPMLPALPLPAFNMGHVLLASLLLILVKPFPGIVVQTVLLVYAVLIDQTRLQPEVVSLVLLLWGTLPNPTAKAFGRAHLVTLWVFAGVNKLLSPGFMDGTAQWLLTGLPVDLPPWMYANAGYVIALAELGTGLLALIPRTRKAAAVAAFGLHAGILLDLSPLGRDWNAAVWPWNLALAFAGFALIAPWQGSLPHCVRSCHRLARPLIVLLIVAPAGFYIGMTDAYLAHNLYSSNTADASVACPGGCQQGQQPGATWDAFNVPLPPEHRLFEQYFARTCRPGDEMTISDPRWWFGRQGQAERRLTCDAAG